MLRLAITFFIISIVAAFFGFSGIASTTADIATFFFWLFFVLFLGTLILGFLGVKTLFSGFGKKGSEI